MGSRILKESICTSDNLDRLSWFEEVLFYRLIVNCDDYGRMDARPPILRSRLFPLKNVTDAQIEKALQSLRSADMIDLYEVDGRSFLQMRTWEKHQTVRAKRSKYPAPECGVMTSENICKQMHADVAVIQSESVSESVSNPRGNKRAQVRFTPPTVEESDAFFTANGATLVQAAKFRAYYESNGWKVGKNPMKDWQAAARGWIARDNDGGFSAPRKVTATIVDPHMQRYSPAERKETYSAAVLTFDE